MNIREENGFIVSIVTFFVLGIMVSVAITMSAVVFYRQQIVTNSIKSTQAFYVAEAGAEDVLMRLRNNSSLSVSTTCTLDGVATNNCYTFSVDVATASVVVPVAVAGSRTLILQGDNSGITKKLQIIYAVDKSLVNFYYGVAVGEGGLVNNGTIHGNVFSNGNITGSGTIDDNVVISGSGNSIKDVYVGGDVLAYSCLSSASVRNLTYVTGGSHTCTVRGTITSQADSIAVEPLPIPDSQITAWKDEAVAGGTFSGNKTITTNQSLGPLKIEGNLTVKSGAQLTLTGTVWVTGTVSVESQGTKIKLDSSYGSLGGTLISDGNISINHPNITITGSGESESYLLVLSTSTSDTAVYVKNNLSGYSAFYASAGGITLSNGVSVAEATGYKVILNNGSEIQYSAGIENIYFSSGPGGTWKPMSWGEE